ncbi:hypothetical protein Tco_1045559 [Tanacetum coccineum]|uniref:Reverse transcriptase domain-containing protein n=1 Tax=Tanacetum coccineum TaxID=301880 RepID=A0ABQ5GTQ1_9ASTR
MDFMIVRSISPYNGIIGRPGIREIEAVPSTAHEMLKFPADGGIVTIRSTILIPAECATVITSPKEIPKEMAESDEEKMAFHTSQKVLLRRLLKNTGATNQRLVDRAFDSHVGRNMEVYVNDLVIKSHTEAEMGGTLPSDRKEASKLHIKARQYELKEGTLYRRSFLKTWLRCLGPLQASYVIREIHEGLCSMHAGPRSVGVAKL